jgi:hypothetical protein
VELLAGLIGALVGVAAGGLSTFLTARVQMRRELEFAHDRELRGQRLEPYKALYRLTKMLPRYWRTPPVRAELSQWSKGFRIWYFDEAGGLFLSDDARVAYLRALEVIATVANAGPGDDQLSEDELTRLWRAGQALRGQLATDVGAANAPRLHGSRPIISPPETVRIVDRPATTPDGPAS